MHLLISNQTIPGDLEAIFICVLRSEPIDANVVVWLHEGPGEEHLQVPVQVVPADDVAVEVLAVRVSVAQANVGYDIVWVAADALVREDGEADETEADEA